MISLAEAQQILKDKTFSFGTELTKLEDAFEKILAEDIYAPRDLPPFNRSAMDGIAIIHDDFKNGKTDFECIETIFAGKAATKEIKPGQCYKIMTGAAVPPPVNTLIRVEDVVFKEQLASISSLELELFQNIATKGQDLKQGELAIQKNTFINPAIVGLLASLGKDEILTKCLPKVNIITTGDEIIDPGNEVSPLHIYNSNKYVLKALLNKIGISPGHIIHSPDEIQLLRENIKKNLKTDILIITGGVSAGDADYIPEILAELGVEKLFHKVAIKPGKPIWCGQINKTTVFALPGNPFSTLVTFKLFVEFFINRCLEINTEIRLRLAINFERTKKSNLDEFFPAQLIENKLNKVNINGSGDIRLGYHATYVCQHSANEKNLQIGQLVNCITL